MQAYKVEAGEPAQLMSSYDGLLASGGLIEHASQRCFGGPLVLLASVKTILSGLVQTAHTSCTHLTKAKCTCGLAKR